MIRNVIRSRHCVQWISKRTYLSEAYKCDGSWAERLETPILKKISIDNLYYDLDLKLQQQKKVSAIDLDIFANKTEELEEIADLAQKLRLSEEASKVLDSTGHALIRNYYQAEQIEALVPILTRRLEYGIFLDNFSANLILDQLLKKHNYKIAARIATIISLQEDFENTITNSMSLLACYKFLGQLEPFEDLKVLEPVVDPEASKSKKKKEEIKIRVKYLRNDFYDDHFDIKNTNHLVGKTILYFADTLKDEVLKNSLQLIGYGLYEKFEEANKFLANNKTSLYKEAVDFAKGLGNAENLEPSDAGKQFFDSLNNVSQLQDGKVDEFLEKLVQETVAEREQNDIEDQKITYSNWTDLRDQRLNEEIDRLNRIKRLHNLETLQEEMKKEEQKLWFFENEDKLDLEIEGKRVYYPKKWLGKKKKPRVVDENYIPPDVDARRNV